jgi:glycosyltransferase involved in cell wall biosynthesis
MNRRFADYWVVIPAYNEAPTIAAVVRACLEHAEHVLVVDDGSDDATAAQLRGLPITLIQHAVNRGKGASLWRGFQHALAADCAGVVTLDGDGQHAPADIANLVTAARTHWDRLIIGQRGRAPRRVRPLRYLANRVADFGIGLVSGYAINDSQSGFRCYPAALLRGLRAQPDKAHSFSFESEALIDAARAGFAPLFVPIETCVALGTRPSHFRPVYDALVIAWRVLRKGLTPRKGKPMEDEPLEAKDAAADLVEQREWR